MNKKLFVSLTFIATFRSPHRLRPRKKHRWNQNRNLKLWQRVPLKLRRDWIYLITQKGTGRLPKVGETVAVHYTGTLTNGVKFDSSQDRGQPISFPLGQGRVIKGWDEGIGKMHVGDRAILVVPSSIGYGPSGRGPIPPGATMIFVVELVEIKE